MIPVLPVSTQLGGEQKQLSTESKLVLKSVFHFPWGGGVTPVQGVGVLLLYFAPMKDLLMRTLYHVIPCWFVHFLCMCHLVTFSYGHFSASSSPPLHTLCPVKTRKEMKREWHRQKDRGKDWQWGGQFVLGVHLQISLWTCGIFVPLRYIGILIVVRKYSMTHIRQVFFKKRNSVYKHWNYIKISMYCSLSIHSAIAGNYRYMLIEQYEHLLFISNDEKCLFFLLQQ